MVSILQRFNFFVADKTGEPLMQCAQKVALDLPQKMLIWEDTEGKVWLTYNASTHVKDRHDLEACDATFTKTSQVLAALSGAASQG